MPALGQLRKDSFMLPFDIIKDRDRVLLHIVGVIL